MWLFLLHRLGFSASLSVGTVNLSESEKGGKIPVEIKLDQGENVSGVQFDILMPSGVVVKEVERGPSVEKANKMATYNRISSHTYRVIVAGLNREGIEDGPIVLVKFELAEPPKSGKYRVKLSNVVLADPDGNSVPCVVQYGAIIFGSSEQSGAVSSVSNNFPYQTPGGDEKNIGMLLLFFAVAAIFVLLLLGYYIQRKVRVRAVNKQSLNRPKQEKYRKLPKGEKKS